MSEDDPRWDFQMREVRRVMDAAAAGHPPVLLEEPMDSHRAVNEMLTLMWAQGGPAMADSADRWVQARGRRILCRVHRPNTDAPLPVLVWLHGGGWVFSSIDTVDKLVREYAAGAQVATVSVDYALSPEARFPQAVLECAAVVRHIAAHGGEWGLDPARIVIGGDSAGGNLAFATALLLRDTGSAALRGILSAYPVTAPDFDSPSYVEFAEGYGLTRAAMKAFWNAYLRDPADHHNPLAAPLRADVSGLPPTLIQLAELDVLRSDGEAMAERLRQAGVPATLETYKGMLHGFIRLTGEVAVARIAMEDACAWLKGRMERSEGP